MAERTQYLHAVHRLIQDLGRDPVLQERFAASPEVVFSEYELTTQQVAALKEGTFKALGSIDVHPVLRMHWVMMSNPEAGAHISVKSFIEKATKGASHG